MAIIDHGSWEHYTPTTMPEGFPAGAVFTRRVGSGEDWYSYKTTIPAGGVVMTVETMPDGFHVIQAVARKAGDVFPVNMQVIADTSYSGNDPFNELHWRVFDPATGTIGGMYEPVPPTITSRQFWMQAAIQDIVSEGEAIGAMHGGEPDYINDIITTLPQSERFAVRMAFAAPEFKRDGLAAKHFLKTDDEVDQFFKAAWKL